MSNDHEKHIVYKVTNNINQMIYIGQTKESLHQKFLMIWSNSINILIKNSYTLKANHTCF